MILNVVMLGTQQRQVGMVGFQQILNGIDGHAGKLPSIILPCDQSPLLPFVLAVVQSCSGDVPHQSSHAHLPEIESIFINGVPKGALIFVDQSQMSILSARYEPDGVGSAAEHKRRRGRCPLTAWR